mgnify:CR=1 FL=1
MAVKFGSSAIGGIVFGGIAMGRAYMGDSLVFPALQSNTIRFKFESGVDPSSATWLGAWVRKSAIPNIWDCHPNSSSWQYKFSGMSYPIYGDYEIVSMNMHGVTDATGAFSNNPGLVKVSGVTGVDNVQSLVGMFSECSNLARVEHLFSDNVIDCTRMFRNCTSLVAAKTWLSPSKTQQMFYGCSSLVNMPDMYMGLVNDASSMYYGCSSLASIESHSGNFSDYLAIGNADYMFYNCVNVASGIIDLYNVWTGSPPLGNPSHASTFYNCGINSASGSQELAQIPASWK